MRVHVLVSPTWVSCDPTYARVTATAAHHTWPGLDRRPCPGHSTQLAGVKAGRATRIGTQPRRPRWAHTPVPSPAAHNDLRRPTQCNAWRYDQAMARNIGPDMLANLDMQRDTGKITAAQYEARRTEVLELIRKGKTVDYSRPERLAIIIGGLLATLLGIVALLSGFSTSNVGQIVLGLAFATLGLLALRRIA